MVEIHRTNPVAEGRYLAFTHAEGAKEWILPVVLLWHGGKWCYEYECRPFPREVYGRTDLLPVGRIADFFPAEPLEFDL